MLDSLIIVPFEPVTGPVLDPHMRSTYLAQVALPLESATIELESYLGQRLNYWAEGARPTIAGRELAFPKTRSLSAVVLASALEHAGLAWHAIDPGVRELDWWRGALRRMRRRTPRTIAVCTTFLMHYPWLSALCRIIRRELPETTVLIGGYYYASNAKNFLSLDADVFCVGEGELRFPEIVRAIRDGASLDHIRGLYVTDGDGRIHHTGHAEFLNLRARPPVDWRLASRIEPPIDLENDLIEAGVETQRGCIFKCEFCSYRTLTPPNALGPDESADIIMQTRVLGNASINVVDATASFPHDRWSAILRELIARGGSPHPIWAFARVTDINDESASLMAAAGVKHLFVGQESGDQRILDAMKKGTKITHVRGAVEALAAHGLTASFGFIHGFPGETDETIVHTRRLIEGLNRGFESRPPVLTYVLYPFTIPQLAAVATRDEFRDVAHYMDYEVRGMDPDRTLAAVLETMVAISRIPHAPAFSHLMLKSLLPTTGGSLFSRYDRFELFRWLKAVERGVSIFLERSLEGTPIDDGELRRVRGTILSAYPNRRRGPNMVMRLLGKPALDRLQREWRAEPRRGPGLATRAFTGAMVWYQTRDAGLAWRAASTGDIVGKNGTARASTEHVSDYAGDLIAYSQLTSHKYPKEALPLAEVRARPSAAAASPVGGA
jgi:anaerobic magnesium-protoporphyrin IX monomethyl ester cyclase